MTQTPTPRSATDASRHAPAAYPMVAPDAATGRVRVVYAEILDRFPMVPSLFQRVMAQARRLAVLVGAAAHPHRLNDHGFVAAAGGH